MRIFFRDAGAALYRLLISRWETHSTTDSSGYYRYPNRFFNYLTSRLIRCILIFFFSCIDGPISLPIKALTKFEMYTLCKEVRRETRSRSPWYSVNSASPDGYPDDQETSPTSTPSLFQYNVDALCIKPMDEFRAYAQYSLLWY